MKRVVALVHKTVPHRHFALVWCSLRKRVDWMSDNVGRGEVKTSLNTNLDLARVVCKLPTSQQMTLHRYWFS